VAVPVVANAGRGLFARALDLPSATPAQACPVMTEQAFQRLYDATSAPILGYLTAVTGHRHIAEDLLQETFIRLLARPRPSMNADETRRYLFRIATNLLRDRWRRNDHQPFTEPVETGQSPRLETSIEVWTTAKSPPPPGYSPSAFASSSIAPAKRPRFCSNPAAQRQGSTHDDHSVA
jgi:DNA-directed RNA polymerase specialized sigma24 family protein